MKTFRVILVLLFESLFVSQGYSKVYTLFNNCHSSYNIVVSEKSSASEKFAAEELQRFLYEISGTKIPIVNTINKNGYNRIIIGYETAKESGLVIDMPIDDEQSFKYYNSGENIVIIGGTNIGTLYGVYSFLENEFDCRWYTANESRVPRKNKWVFSSLNICGSPAFNYRFIYSKGAFDKLWSLRNNNNGNPDNYITKYGSISISQFPFWSVHTFNRFVSPSIYYDEHPEYYSLINGKRTAKQLCLTNKDVKRICLDGLRDIIKKHPEFLVYDLSQNDNLESCNCRKCKKIKKKTGSESGLIIWFVNQVAKELSKEFPEKYIGLLAYQNSQRPPKSILPIDNEVIRLSVINTCLIHGYKDCDKNMSTASDIKEWTKISKNVFIWDYISTSRFNYVPIPNFNAIQDRLQYYHSCGVKGVLLEGNASIEDGEFSDLRNYVMSKLLWNPYVNLDEVVEDFIEHYYGDVSSLMIQYYRMTQNRAKEQNQHLFFVMNHQNKIFSEDYLENAYAVLCRAEKESGDESIINKIKTEKMSVAYMLCKVNPKKAIKTGAYSFVREWTINNHIEKFAGYGENSDTKDFFNQMQQYIENK